MPKGTRLWTDENLRLLRTLAASGKTPEEAAAHFGVTAKAVRAQASNNAIGWPACAGVWTAERVNRLRVLWQSDPRPTLAEIRADLKLTLSISRISLKAKELGLPPYRVLMPREKEGAPAPARVPAPSAAVPAGPRVPPLPKVAGCPFYDPRISRNRCGRPGKPYCRDHEHRIMPVSRGVLGYARRTHSGGFLAGAL